MNIESNGENNENDSPKQGSMLSTILRQEMNNYTPFCNVTCSIYCNLCLIIFFLALGIPIIIMSNSVKEYYVDYTDW